MTFMHYFFMNNSRAAQAAVEVRAVTITTTTTKG
jgi:hypothetical protein